MRATQRLGGFALNQLLLAAASLILVPAVIGAGGLDNWASVALGQAVAQIVATVVGCGYGVIGPSTVATSTLKESVSYFRLAERTRLVVAGPCFTVMVVVLLVIPNPNPAAGILGGAPLAIGAFSATFFYVGRAAPLWLLFAETGPRVLLTFAGAISLTLGAPLLVGLALPSLGALLGIAISNITIRKSAPQATATRPASVRDELRKQVAPGATSVLRGGRDAIPVLVVTAIAAELLAAFGLFDRLIRQVVGVLTPLSSTLQRWVPRRMAAQGNARPVGAAILAGLAVATVIFALFALWGSRLISWMAAGKLTPTFAETALCGAVIATSMLIPIIAYACLVPLGGMRGIITGSILGIITVLVAMPVLLSVEKSLTFALMALIIGNVVQIAFEMLVLRFLITRRN